jgi:hypothetical protein
MVRREGKKQLVDGEAWNLESRSGASDLTYVACVAMTPLVPG